MKNVIEYFYKIKVDTIKYADNKYYIKSNNDNYLLQEFNRKIDFKILKESQLYEKFHKVMFNFYGGIVTNYENNNYILLKVNIEEKNRIINFNDIINIAELNVITTFTELKWDILWSNKIDNFESYIMNKDLNFDFREYYDYFIGLGEIAIIYYQYAKNYPVKYGFTYNRIRKNFTLYDLYNPLNVVISSPVKGIAEYIKEMFFDENMLEIEIIKNLNLNYYETILFICRLIFPTYFFDIFHHGEKINIDRIKKIITLIPKYEKYLKVIFEVIKKRYSFIPLIEWLMF